MAYALVDDEDEQLVAPLSWSLNDGYAVTAMRDGPRWRTVRMSRLIMGLMWGDGRKVDHKNRNTLDNRRENLRIGTHAQNHQNRSSGGNRNTSSRYRGVSRRGKKWRAYVTVDGKRQYLGDHDSEDTAGRVAASARRELMPWSKEAASA